MWACGRVGHHMPFYESSTDSGSHPWDDRRVGREESVVLLWPGLVLPQPWVWHARYRADPFTLDWHGV